MKMLTLAASALALSIAAFEPASATSLQAGYYGAGEHAVVQVTYGRRVPLQRVLYALHKKGFSDFRNIDWTNYTYKITARRYGGHLFRITVNAYNGSLISIARIYPHRYQHWSGGHGWGHGGYNGWGSQY